MPNPDQSLRTACIRSDVLERERFRRGWSLDELAKQADVNIKTLGRVIKGKPAYWSTIKTIAHALGLEPEALHDAGHHQHSSSQTFFEIRVRTFGTIEGPEQLALLMRVAEELVANLSAKGIDVVSQENNLSLSRGNKDSERLLICVEGVRSDASNEVAMLSFHPPALPWFYCAIRPDKLADFERFCAQAAFDPEKLPRIFGEQLAVGFGIVPHSTLTDMILRSLAVSPSSGPSSDATIQKIDPTAHRTNRLSE